MQSLALFYNREMTGSQKRRRRLTPIWRAALEIAFIIFLFYTNLLMGDFTSTNERGRTLARALLDIVTPTNFCIAIVSALIGYVGFEYLRKKL
jgi:hypothetical protein